MAQLWRALGQPTRPVPSTSVLRNVVSVAKSALSRRFPEGTFVAAYPTLSAICEWLLQLLFCNNRHASPVFPTITITITFILTFTFNVISTCNFTVTIRPTAYTLQGRPQLGCAFGHLERCGYLSQRDTSCVH